MMEGVGRRLRTSSGFLLNIGSRSLNGRENNVLFRNNGDETFTEVAIDTYSPLLHPDLRTIDLGR